MGLVITFSVLALFGCTLDNIAARQEKTTGLWDELVGDESFGQSFVCTLDNLYRIDLSTATYDRRNSSLVIFHLKDSPEASTDLISITLSGSDIQNERPTSFVFPPLPDSKGRLFYFYIESPDATPGNAITVYANEFDQYPDGVAYRNGHQVSGDLAFTAFSLDTFTLSGMWRSFMSRITQDLPFFILYGILILVNIAVLLISVTPFSRKIDRT
jgi:hypothetical protein